MFALACNRVCPNGFGLVKVTCFQCIFQELQAKQASARLAGTSHIKLQPFDPETTKRVEQYREPAHEADVGSDSDEDAQEMDYPD
jgi:hypothetical protein